MSSITIRNASKQTVTIGAGLGFDGYDVPINAIARDQRVLFEDDFRHGPQGWTQLMHKSFPVGALSLDGEVTFNGSPYSLILQTGAYTDTESFNWGSCTAIKRMGRGDEVGKLYLEFFFGWGAEKGQDRPRAYDFGCDQCDPDGNRKYFKIRWCNYDAAVPARVAKWQLHDAEGGYVDIEGAGIDLGFNENKRNLHHVEMIFDIDAGVYDGFRINGKGFGSLAPTPDTSLRAYGPSAETLNIFKSGFNASFDVRNRYDTADSVAWGVLAYARGVLLP